MQEIDISEFAARSQTKRLSRLDRARRKLFYQEIGYATVLVDPVDLIELFTFIKMDGLPIFQRFLEACSELECDGYFCGITKSQMAVVRKLHPNEKTVFDK